VKIAIIVAMDEDGLIGVDGGLPWRLPDDLARFKRLTMGHALIMGRRTYDSIGRPLPGRRTLVISRDAGLVIDGVRVCGDLDAALDAVAADGDETAFIAGGAEIYALAMPRATHIHMTRVHERLMPPAGASSVYFPALDERAWRETAREEHPADERHAYAFAFVDLEQASPAATG